MYKNSLCLKARTLLLVKEIFRSLKCNILNYHTTRYNNLNYRTRLTFEYEERSLDKLVSLQRVQSRDTLTGSLYPRERGLFPLSTRRKRSSNKKT